MAATFLCPQMKLICIYGRQHMGHNSVAATLAILHSDNKFHTAKTHSTWPCSFHLLQKMKALATLDAQGMSPLHCAAMFDHPRLVAFLIQEVTNRQTVHLFFLPPLHASHISTFHTQYYALTSLIYFSSQNCHLASISCPLFKIGDLNANTFCFPSLASIYFSLFLYLFSLE